MLLVMQPDSSQADIAAVCQRATDAGFETAIFEADSGAIVLVGGHDGEAAEQFVGVPGIARIVRPRPPRAPATSNLRIAGIRPLVPPAILMERLPLPAEGAIAVHDARQQISRILRGADDRLIVVVGPCSIHDADAALVYARGLAALAANWPTTSCIVMRVYFEKPRTTVGWKGLINDPAPRRQLRTSTTGLRLARQLLLDLTELGVPAGTEFLDTITPQFIADLVAWGAIGARTTESQVHRELASGLSMPVGFKNGTDGDVQIAIDAMQAAAHPHQLPRRHRAGRGRHRRHHAATRTATSSCAAARAGPNYDAESVAAHACAALEAPGCRAARHGRLQPRQQRQGLPRQPLVAADLADQIAGGETRHHRRHAREQPGRRPPGPRSTRRR